MYRIGTTARRRLSWSVLVAALSIPSFGLMGCATTKDLQTLRGEVQEQLSTMKNELVQSRQALEAMKTDVALLKSIGVAVEAVKGRVDTIQSSLQALQNEADSHRTALSNLRGDFREFKVAHEGVARETDRLRASVGSLEQGMLHQLQVEVNLARERIKQLELVIGNLTKVGPEAKAGPTGDALRVP